MSKAFNFVFWRVFPKLWSRDTTRSIKKPKHVFMSSDPFLFPKVSTFLLSLIYFGDICSSESILQRVIFIYLFGQWKHRLHGNNLKVSYLISLLLWPVMLAFISRSTNTELLWCTFMVGYEGKVRTLVLSFLFCWILNSLLSPGSWNLSLYFGFPVTVRRFRRLV